MLCDTSLHTNICTTKESERITENAFVYNNLLSTTSRLFRLKTHNFLAPKLLAFSSWTVRSVREKRAMTMKLVRHFGSEKCPKMKTLHTQTPQLQVSRNILRKFGRYHWFVANHPTNIPNGMIVRIQMIIRQWTQVAKWPIHQTPFQHQIHSKRSVMNSKAVRFQVSHNFFPFENFHR